MNPLERLPYDIWHLIFQQLCTDGGSAGCALACTSKTIRAFAASSRFYSLTLTSLIQVKNFLICLERIRRFNSTQLEHSLEPTSSPTETPPIHHLLLSFVPPTCDAPQRTFRKWTDYARGERTLHFQLSNDHKVWATEKTAWNRQLVLHLSRLLQVAAPTLRSLAFLQCAEVRLPLLALPRDGFPVLRELTLLADDRALVRAPGPGALVAGQNDPSDFVYYGVPVDLGPLLPNDPIARTSPVPSATAASSDANSDGAASPFAERPPSFPALTHLHIVCTGAKLHGWERTLPRWAAIAPALTHLRVSQANSRIPPALAELLGVPTPPHEESPVEPISSSLPFADLEPAPRGDASAIATISVASASDLSEPLPPLPAFDRMRTVIVQMSGTRKSSMEGVRDPNAAELRRIADACAEFAEGESGRIDFEIDTPRVVLLKSRAYLPGYWEARLAWDWRERMLGGGGCWTEDEADEHAWKVFPSLVEGRSGKKGHVSVNVAETVSSHSGLGGHSVREGRQGKKWWSALSNGMARAKRGIAA